MIDDSIDVEPPDETSDSTLQLIDSISKGYVVPILGSAFGDDLIFGSHDKLVEGWAKYIKYPITAATSDSLNLPWLAQYDGVQKAGPAGKTVTVKQKYLKYLKAAIDSRAEKAWGVSEKRLKQVRSQAGSMTVSDLLRSYIHPSLDSEQENPLLYLSYMPLPIYLTTSYHDCLEVALLEKGKKKPRTEICYWHEDLRGIRSVFEQDKNYTPTPEEPLVLHLFGWDEHPQSLVLTEDDCLDFLANVPGNDLAIPKVVKAHLTLSSVAMLGYRLRDWEFRVVFRGVIRALERIQGTCIAIQVEEASAAKAYLEKYMPLVAFDVVWKKPGEFITELYEGLGGSS